MNARTGYLVVAAALVVVWVAVRPVRAQPAADQPGTSAATVLQEAARAIEAGEYERARALAQRVLTRAASGQAVARQDRAEAWRLAGLALFFLERRSEAEAAFFEYLKLDVNGRLDPALVPPEAVLFFESVHARRAGQLQLFRPRPRRSWWYNLVPPAGQFQNGHRKKAWLILGSATALGAANITSYALLARWCDARTNVCQTGDGESRTGSANTMRQVNLVSGVLLIGLGAYGIIDGFVNYDRHDTSTSVSVSVTPGAGHVVLQTRF